MSTPSSTPISSPTELERLRPRLLALSLHLTRNRSDAEDLVQVAMLRALERFATMPDSTDWPSWTATVVRRLAIDRHRHNQRWLETPHDDAIAPSTQDATSDPGSPLTPSLLDLALQSVAASARDICRLHYFHALSYQRIGVLLGIPMRTVGTRLHRARLQLRRHLSRLSAHRAARLLAPERPALVPPAPADVLCPVLPSSVARTLPR